MASTDQLFQFDGQLYEQREGVAMGSPLGPLLANVFMCNLEELSDNGLIPSFYKRYVDDTLAIMPGVDAAENFLDVLNVLHLSIHFTMELSNNDSIPFIGTFITKNGNKLETQVYHKPTNTGLLLHFQSHTDLRYKRIALVIKETPVTEQFSYFLHLLKDYPYHSFKAKWQKEEFNNLVNNLPLDNIMCPQLL